MWCAPGWTDPGGSARGRCGAAGTRTGGAVRGGPRNRPAGPARTPGRGPYRAARRGTVVAAPKLVQPLSLRSYTEGAAERGRVPGRLLVELGRISEAGPELAAALAVAPGSTVMQLERVLLADGRRIGLESTYLAAGRFGGRCVPPSTRRRRSMRRSGPPVWSSGRPPNASRPRWPHRVSELAGHHDGHADAAAAPPLPRHRRGTHRDGARALSR